MAPASQTAAAVKAAAEKRTANGVLFMDCAVCGKTTRKWRSNIEKAKWPITCGRKCRGLLMRGPNNPGWKGGYTDTRSGYRLMNTDVLPPEDKALLANPNARQIPEHRLVIARLLGRPLLTSEHVHHINGVKTDNRPENLTLMDWATHTREHRKVLRRLAALETENKILRAALAQRQADAGRQT
jgi:hypothetical protein